MKTTEEALQAIETTVNECTLGWANLEATRRIEEAVSVIRINERMDSYLIEKLTSLRGWTEILFSARKHVRYGGIDQVRHFLLTECDKIRSYCHK